MPLIPSDNIRVWGFETADDADFFKGSMDYKNLQWDPFVTGYSFIVWYKVPFWIEKTFGATSVRNFMQKNFHSFSGISSIELQTGTQSHGFTGNESNFATTIQKGNTDFSIKMQEFSGSPVRNLFQFWVSGIRDPESGIATYPKLFNCDYAAKNHTGQLLYIVTRPDANNIGQKNIEFACFYDAVFPVSIPLDHMNYDKGSHDDTEIDINFKGVFHMSPEVDNFARKSLEDIHYLREESEYLPTGHSIGGADRMGDSQVKPGEFPWLKKDSVVTG
jgi:hypothetical protein